MPRLLLVTFALLTLAGQAHAELNIAPGAHLTASSWFEQTLVTDRRDDLPRNAVDGSSETGWRPAAGAAAPHWLRFDFTRPWPMRYAWKKLVTTWSEAPAAYRWEVSRDGSHWVTLAARSSPKAEDSVTVEGTGSYLRIVVPGGTEARLLEVQAYAGSGGSGRVAVPALRLEGNQAFLDWSDSAVRNVFTYRVVRTASLPVGDSGATAGTTALIEEAPVLAVIDRVDHPTVSGLSFDFRWTVEAFGPDGKRIGRAASTEPRLVTERSPRPFLMRGVVEGYYGPGYSDLEREDLIRFTGNQGGNFYLYGPKLDLLHREKWRDPYPQERIDAFLRWHEVAQDHGVRFAWSLSPGLDFDGSAADTQAVLDKYQVFHDLGMRWFALLMDDIPVDADVTEAVKQVTLANTLLAHLRESDPFTYLVFVPTVYYGVEAELVPQHRRYLTALRALHPDTIVMWTGSGVFSPALTHDLVDPIAALVGHPLVIWDNFPVADFFLGKRANLGAVEGRAANLGEPVGETLPVAGLLANPLALPAANRLPLATVLNYLRDPEGYEPKSALREQLRREAPESDVALLERWLAAFGTNGLIGVDENEATRAVAAAEAALDKGESTGEAFAKHAAALYTAEPALRRLYHPDMAGDLLPLAKKSALLGEAELRVLRAASGGEPGDDLTVAGELLAAAKKSGWVITEGADERWLTRALKNPPNPENGPVLAGNFPTRVTVGGNINGDFALGDATAATVIGLPGASFRDGRLSWRAGHTGVERWVLIASNTKGVSVRFGEILVVQQESEENGGCAAGGAGHGAPLALLALAALAYRRVRFNFTSRGPIG